ncbi:fibulin-2 isoform X2 [Scyliorhinus canicula]|uniref:fibulin-2 isoform X2 n=1 Tax=Scyliorhinus canicula TaxID=7830 RepID=UPI0018F290E2|nr:fibulin-2 isoform X2 [Scyliorhinus canicula]
MAAQSLEIFGLLDLRIWFCLLISCGSCLAQKDCTGVNCPLLENCIEEVLEPEACCASCMQYGCKCEGYQYYDCVNGGFRDGKVPEGSSYFVDFGSTECACPSGGGRISCYFIPCPELPQNCIEVLEPVEGCQHCAKVGCLHGSQKYIAGHTFHMPPCKVCHCPNSGGDLMCYALPDCDPAQEMKTVYPKINENEEPVRHYDDQYSYDQEPPDNEHFLKESSKQSKEDGPLNRRQQKSAIRNLDIDDDENEDYDYKENHVIPNSPHGPFYTTKATDIISITPVNTTDEYIELEKEGKDTWGEGELQREQITEKIMLEEKIESMENKEEQTDPMFPKVKFSLTKQPPIAVKEDDNAVPNKQPQSLSYYLFDEEEDTNSIKLSPDLDEGNAGHNISYHFAQTIHPSDPSLLTSVAPYPSTSEGANPPTGYVSEEEAKYSNDDLSASRFTTAATSGSTTPATSSPTPSWHLNYSSTGSEKPTVKEVDDVIESCCTTGQQWAANNSQCFDIPVRSLDSATCRIAQKQCCVSYMEERSCLVGINFAKENEDCYANPNDVCGADIFTKCCDCCMLGIIFRSQYGICEEKPSLGYPCSQAYFSCCEWAEDITHFPVKRWLKPKPRPEPPLVPDQVLETENLKEALSLSEEEAEFNFITDDELNECSMYPGQLCQHFCIKTTESYECTCFPGYILQTDGRTCKSEYEDEGNSFAEVKTTEVSRTGISPEMDRCGDASPCMHYCTQIGGDIICSCFSGYRLMPDNFSCEDVNECIMDSHNCSREESCENTQGSFQCVPAKICENGFIRNANDKCVDINECERNNHNCAVNYECQNTPGSFSCRPKMRCSEGFLQDSHGICHDINECTALDRPCKPAFNCINTVGSYSCQRNVITCGRGYHSNPDGTHCIDVDECQSGVHRCGEGQVCQNIPGNYRCDCQSGYQINSLSRTCIDVNECWRYPGRLCAHTCENTPGSYYCTCSTGFKLTPDGKNCEDINECENNLCGQECANIYGSYQCYCRQGYHLTELDGHSCEDIDECAQSGGTLCTFRCVNVPGSYNCACPEVGYTMSPNGRTCRDIDECAIGTHNCTSTETCFNIQGGFRCPGVDCPPNYRKVSDMRCERMMCPNYMDCQNTPIRITYYQLTFPTNVQIPSTIFRIAPSPVYMGDSIVLTITKGNTENFFSTRKVNAYTGVVYVQRQFTASKDFLLDVEMKLWRQGMFTSFLAKIYVFVSAHPF